MKLRFRFSNSLDLFLILMDSSVAQHWAVHLAFPETPGDLARKYADWYSVIPTAWGGSIQVPGAQGMESQCKA